MKPDITFGRSATLATLLGLLVCSGCQHYEVAVTIEPDGSGQRRVALIDDGNWQEQNSPTFSELRQLFCVTAEEGWQPLAEMPGRAKSDSQQTEVGFWRDARVSDLSNWYERSGDIQIRGTLAAGPYEKVRFRNSVAVEMGEDPHGRTYTYRESFTWTGLEQVVVDFVADHFRATMADAYPFLGGEELAELRGLMTGHLSLGWFALAVADQLEENAQPIVQSVAARAAAIVRRARPNADLRRVRPLVEHEVLLQGDEGDAFLEENLPGFFAVGFTEIQLSVKLPGLVTETNGERGDGGVVSWKIDVFDAATLPIQLYARSHLVE